MWESWWVNARITLPKAERDELMKQASLRDSPPVPVRDCLSLPARSIKWNWDFRVTVIVSWISYRSLINLNLTSHVIYTVKTACERDERIFILVTPTWRFWSPCSTIQRASAAFDTLWIVKFSMEIWWSLEDECSRISWMKEQWEIRQRIFNFLVSWGFNKSFIFSL